jgi:hypothetical protein
MSLSLTSENKNTVTLSPEAKDTSTTWDEATYTWDQADGTWNEPGFVTIEEDKNVTSLTYENKN